MHRTRLFTIVVLSNIVVATGALLIACGDDTSKTGITSGTSATITSQPADTVSGTSDPVQLDQPAIWPAADVVFTTPEQAAADFVAQVLGDGPVLGDFVGGDQRSGEIEVFASVDGARISTARSVLFLRQLGPSDGWFVIGAGSDIVTVTTPESNVTVTTGPLAVQGLARGFEANVVVSAFVAGRADPVLDKQSTMAGNLDESLPYSVTLDLSAAAAGDVVVLLVRGGAGLETDPGDFGAIAVVIGD